MRGSRERKRDKQTDRHTYRQRERQANRQTYIQTEREAKRLIAYK